MSGIEGLDRLAVGGFEAEAPVDKIVHNHVVLLLDVAEDAEARASRHREARGAVQVQRHEDVRGVEGEIRAVEVEHHVRVHGIRHPSRREAVLQPEERPVRVRVRNRCFDCLQKSQQIPFQR